MNKRLTLSIHHVEGRDSEKPDTFRAILWNGRLTKHIESVKFGAESVHQNFFVAVRSIKAAVKDWQGRMREQQEKLWEAAQSVAGIDTNDACWPIDPQTSLEEAFSVTDLLSPGKKGLVLAPMFREED